MREAPFKVGGVVEPPYFVNREKELQRLAQDLRDLSQNYLILAPRRYGKSSLLHNLRLQVKDEEDLLVPYVNCREIASYTDFYRITVAAVLQEYERKRRVSGLWKKFRVIFQERILQAVRRLEEIGGSIQELGQVYLQFREEEVDERALVRAAFQFFRRLAEEKGLRIVLLLDEFQEVAAFNEYLFNVLKKELDLPSQVRYFFSGSSMSLPSEIFLQEKAPLYLMVGKHYMEPLAQEDVVAFVRERLQSVGITIEEDAAEWIYERSGGIPFYIQKLGLIAFHQALLQGASTLSQDDVQRAFAAMLDELDGEFEVRWLSRSSSLQRLILRALAEAGEARLSKVAQRVGRKPSDISSSVTRLKEMMILKKLPSGAYTIVDPVFAAWLTRSVTE
jgi:AAA+ ATPase superfamily predicted ATPase